MRTLTLKELRLAEEAIRTEGVFSGTLYHHITNCSSYTRVDFEDIKTFDFEALTETEKELFTEKEIETLKKLDNPLLKSEEKLTLKVNIEGTDVELVALFNRQNLSIKYQIVGKKHFRIASKKAKMEEVFEAFEKEVKKYQKELDDLIMNIREKFVIISDIRQTLAIITSKENDNLSVDEFVDALNLLVGYQRAENKEEFLKENNFRGLENLNFYSETPDGFGHKMVNYTAINFITREIKVSGGCSCD